MKYILLLFLGLLSSSYSFAQKVFTVEYENQADVKVFVVKYENQADLKICFVEYKNQAGLENNNLKHIKYNKK